MPLLRTPSQRTYCYRICILLSRLAILPWGNCKTYSISSSWWILCVSKVWSSRVDHVNAISKHVRGTPIFIKEHLKPNAKCFLLNYPNTAVWVKPWNFSPLPKEFSTLYPVMDIMLFLSLGRIYPWNMCLNTFSFPLFCLIWQLHFSFPLVCLNLIVIYIIWGVIFPCLCKHLVVSLFQ